MILINVCFHVAGFDDAVTANIRTGPNTDHVFSDTAAAYAQDAADSTCRPSKSSTIATSSDASPRDGRPRVLHWTYFDPLPSGTPVGVPPIAYEYERRRRVTGPAAA